MFTGISKLLRLGHTPADQTALHLPEPTSAPSTTCHTEAQLCASASGFDEANSNAAALNKQISESCEKTSNVAIDHDDHLIADEELCETMEQDIPRTTVVCDSLKLHIGTVFESLSEARSQCVEYARCPLAQKSTKKLKYVKFVCFRSGICERKSSSVPEEFQREKKTTKSNCPFYIRLRQATGVNNREVSRVYDLCNEHNHELYDQDELAALRYNRFIPDDIREKCSN